MPRGDTNRPAAATPLGGEKGAQRPYVGSVEEMDDIRTPAEEDAAVEAMVLRQLLALHPIQVTFDELLREVEVDPEDFAQRDAFERAVRDLAAAGLAHRRGDFVQPSRAALRFDELLGC